MFGHIPCPLLFKRTTAYLPAILSGILLTLTFPKIEWSLLAWVALVPLLAALGQQPSVRSAFKLGLLCGLVHYVTLLHWLVDTMQLYGGLPLMVGASVLLLLAAYLALFYGLFSAALAYCARRPGLVPVIGPSMWVALEYLRSWLLTGFPWELLGYSQYRYLKLIQIADIGGVYAISYIIVLINSAVVLLWLFITGKSWQGFTVHREQASSSVAAAALILISVLAYGHWRIVDVQKLTQAAPSVTIAFVQGNIDQAVKWDPAFQFQTLEKYLDMSRAIAAADPDLIVWPETATPFYFIRDVPLTFRVTEMVAQSGIPFLIGSPSFIQDTTNQRYYNSAYLVLPDGRIAGRYDKAHLVPFGEYVPLQRWLPFLGKMVEHVGDFNAGRPGLTLQHETLALGILICYESIFAYLGREAVRNGANLLVIMTNDAWYGTSSGPYQHFSMAVLRAVENRRALVRVANTGISGFIQPDGSIKQTTALSTNASDHRALPLVTTSTVYTRRGDVFAMLCAAFGLTATGLRFIAGNRREEHKGI